MIDSESMRLRTKFGEHKGCNIMEVHGEVDVYTVTKLECLAGMLESAPKGLIVDLQQTTYLDGSGCSWLIKMFYHARDIGKVFRVRARDQGIVKKVLGLTKLDQLLEVEYHPN